jgi:hypothetical protein
LGGARRGVAGLGAKAPAAQWPPGGTTGPGPGRGTERRGAGQEGVKALAGRPRPRLFGEARRGARRRERPRLRGPANRAAGPARAEPRQHGGRRGARPPVTRRCPARSRRARAARGPAARDEQVRSAAALPAGLPRLEGGDQDAAGARRRSARSVGGGGGGGAGGLCVAPGLAQRRRWWRRREARGRIVVAAAAAPSCTGAGPAVSAVPAVLALRSRGGGAARGRGARGADAPGGPRRAGVRWHQLLWLLLLLLLVVALLHG